jgi:hypothetical protein
MSRDVTAACFFVRGSSFPVLMLLLALPATVGNHGSCGRLFEKPLVSR